MDFSQLCLLIPAYQPTPLLIKLVSKLLPCHYRRIIVVNDGSGKDSAKIFAHLQTMPGVTVLHHHRNLGKGSALKTALRWVLKKAPTVVGIITMDADGQHLPKDVRTISKAFLTQPEDLVLGVRQFHNKKIPWRSRFGNWLTRLLFRYKYHINLQDTQTGLRGMPQKILNKFSRLSEARYEFDMACLMAAVKTDMVIRQVSIHTIYTKGNLSSHFRPVLDSMRVYYVFMRFALISFLSYCLELSLFIAMHHFTHKIFISLLVARILSSSFNFCCNKFAVYHSHNIGVLKREIPGYTLLGILVFLLSYLLITGCVHLGMGVIKAKIVVDMLLFLFNFTAQRLLIFKHHEI